MAEVADDIQPGVSHKDRSPGAFSIFFGKASLDQIKDIARNRPNSFPRQYPEDDKEESPGSVGKKAAFFDQFIRRSSFDKVAESFDGHDRASMKHLSSEGTRESETEAKSENNSLSVARGLVFSSAENPENPNMKEAASMKVSFIPESNSFNAGKVEEEKFSQQMWDLNLLSAADDHESLVKPAGAEGASFDGSQIVDTNETEHFTSNKAVQVDADILNEYSPLEEHSGDGKKYKSYIGDMELKDFLVDNYMKNKPQDSTYVENSRTMSKKSPLQQRKTSLKPTKSQQSSLVMGKERLPSSTATASRKSKDVGVNKGDEEAKVKMATINAINRSSTHRAVPLTNGQELSYGKTSLSKLNGLHGRLLSSEKSNPLTKGPLRQVPHKEVAATGNGKISSTLIGKDLKVLGDRSHTTEKVSSPATNGSLMHICFLVPLIHYATAYGELSNRAHQHISRQGLAMKRTEMEKSVARIRELPPKPIPKKVSAVSPKSSNLSKPNKGEAISISKTALPNMPNNNGNQKPAKPLLLVPKTGGGRNLAAKVSDNSSSKTAIPSRSQPLTAIKQRSSVNHSSSKRSQASSFGSAM